MHIKRGCTSVFSLSPREMFHTTTSLPMPAASRKGFRFLCLWGCWCVRVRRWWVGRGILQFNSLIVPSASLPPSLQRKGDPSYILSCALCAGTRVGNFLSQEAPSPTRPKPTPRSFSHPSRHYSLHQHKNTSRCTDPAVLGLTLTISSCLLQAKHLTRPARIPPGENRCLSRPEAVSHTCTSPSSRDTARWLPPGQNIQSSLPSSLSDIAAWHPRG